MGSVEMIRIPADPAVPIERVQVEYSLDRMQSLVGGYIEHVALPGAVIVVNEEGKLQGLPLNARATSVWWLAQMSRHGAHTQDALAGDAVIAGIDGEEYGEVPLEIEMLVDVIRAAE